MVPFQCHALTAAAGAACSILCSGSDASSSQSSPAGLQAALAAAVSRYLPFATVKSSSSSSSKGRGRHTRPAITSGSGGGSSSREDGGASVARVLRPSLQSAAECLVARGWQQASGSGFGGHGWRLAIMAAQHLLHANRIGLVICMPALALLQEEHWQTLLRGAACKPSSSAWAAGDGPPGASAAAQQPDASASAVGAQTQDAASCSGGATAIELLLQEEGEEERAQESAGPAGKARRGSGISSTIAARQQQQEQQQEEEEPDDGEDADQCTFAPSGSSGTISSSSGGEAVERRYVVPAAAGPDHLEFSSSLADPQSPDSDLGWQTVSKAGKQQRAAASASGSKQGRQGRYAPPPPPPPPAPAKAAVEAAMMSPVAPGSNPAPTTLGRNAPAARYHLQSQSWRATQPPAAGTAADANAGSCATGIAPLSVSPGTSGSGWPALPAAPSQQPQEPGQQREDVDEVESTLAVMYPGIHSSSDEQGSGAALPASGAHILQAETNMAAAGSAGDGAQRQDQRRRRRQQQELQEQERELWLSLQLGEALCCPITQVGSTRTQQDACCLSRHRLSLRQGNASTAYNHLHMSFCRAGAHAGPCGLR